VQYFVLTPLLEFIVSSCSQHFVIIVFVSSAPSGLLFSCRPIPCVYLFEISVTCRAPRDLYPLCPKCSLCCSASAFWGCHMVLGTVQPYLPCISFVTSLARPHSSFRLRFGYHFRNGPDHPVLSQTFLLVTPLPTNQMPLSRVSLLLD